MEGSHKKQSLKEIKIEEVKSKEIINLGDVIYIHLDFIRSEGVSKITITLDNAYLKGTFVLPNDLGLLTPISFCEGGVLHFGSSSCKSRKIDYVKLLKKWEGKKESTVLKFKECMKSCGICLEDYTPEDELIKLPCDHIFHNSCISKSKDTTLEKGSTRYHTCPLCRNPI